MSQLAAVWLSLQMDGVGVTGRRIWEQLFSEQEWFVFVRSLTPPARPVALPLQVNDVTIRAMAEVDIDAVARLVPFAAKRRGLAERRARMRASLGDALVATRDTRIVGAAWYTARVTAEQPWFRAVEPHLVMPARLTGNIVAVPGEKGAAWALAKQATDYLATQGVRSIVGIIQSENKPSILVSRMLGGRIVARQRVRCRFGRRTITVDAIADHGGFGPAAAA